MRFPLIALVLALVLVAGTMIYAQDKDEPLEIPAEIIINNPDYRNDTKGPVTFAHKVHIYGYGISCSTCHHDYQEDGSNTWTEKDPVKKCTECHFPVERQGRARTLKGAYHGSCVTCHFSFIYRNMSNKAPYKDCDRCHQETQ
jgi:hypothetical protein